MATRSWNKVELMGNLTRDPELRYTPNGAAVCTFGLATNRSYLVDGVKKEDVDFHKIVAWSKLGELCNQLLKKGTRVFVSGRLQYREWEPAEGQKRREAEISIDDMIIVTPKGGTYEGASSAVSSPSVTSPVDDVTPPPTDDIPATAPVEEVVEAPQAEEGEEDKSKKSKPTGEENVSPDEDLPF
jgi:single-strand DNA-binding protein